jgi:hypothetical protein
MIATHRSIEVPCTVDIEHTTDSLHAYVDLAGVDVGPGDRVIVHGAPTQVAFGDRVICQCYATVTRASVLDRLMAKLVGYRELTELYEVSFSDGRAE